MPQKTLEERRVYHQAWREAHREELRARSRTDYWARHDQVISQKRANRAKHRNHRNAQDRNSNYKKKFGITLDEYNEILLAQSGRCLVCGEEPNGWALAVDHNHASGR